MRFKFRSWRKIDQIAGSPCANTVCEMCAPFSNSIKYIIAFKLSTNNQSGIQGMPAGEIESVQELLDHKHITTTQIYDKRRRSVRDSASHKVPI